MVKNPPKISSPHHEVISRVFLQANLRFKFTSLFRFRSFHSSSFSKFVKLLQALSKYDRLISRIFLNRIFGGFLRIWYHCAAASAEAVRTSADPRLLFILRRLLLLMKFLFFKLKSKGKMSNPMA